MNYFESICQKGGLLLRHFCHLCGYFLPFQKDIEFLCNIEAPIFFVCDTSMALLIVPVDSQFSTGLFENFGFFYRVQMIVNVLET
jgi:hypothetical protein